MDKVKEIQDKLKEIESNRNLLDKEKKSLIKELKGLCHHRYEKKNYRVPGSYYDKSENWEYYECEICGHETERKLISYGWYE